MNRSSRIGTNGIWCLCWGGGSWGRNNQEKAVSRNYPIIEITRERKFIVFLK